MMYKSMLHIIRFIFCIDDDAYLENGDDLTKHLVGEVGTIWKGTSRQPRPLLWEYGQVSWCFIHFVQCV